MNFFISIISFAVMISIVVFVSYLIYFFFFSRNNPLGRSVLRNKINNIIKKEGLKYDEIEFKKINSVWFLIDKKNNKFYSL